jgi:hypothetical protein
MATSLKTPKIFISYSWKPETNKQRTISLAERLTNDGVNVIIDVWHLAEGQDKYQFMERMVNDSEIDRVLIICNKDYSEKANAKKGGVGVESLIISDDIYKQADQKKFIPIIFERSTDGKEHVPTFVHSRIYIDLSNDSLFEEEYEKLLRNIYDKPLSRKPALGTPPAYLLEEDPTFLRTAHKVKTIENALINEKKNFQVFVDDYYETFILALKDFEISDEEINVAGQVDEVVLKRIEELKALRDDFIKFIETLFTYSAQLDVDKFISFIEKVLEFIMTHESSRYPIETVGYLKIDQYRFFISELFLYLTAVLLRKEKFKELGAILNGNFVSYSKKAERIQSFPFTILNQHVSSLDKFRNKRLNMSRISIKADLIKQRADNPKYSFDNLVECDIILYYTSIMLNETDKQFQWIRWWPYLTAYRTGELPILDKLVSAKHCEKISPLFGVNSFDELKQKIQRTNQIKADQLERYDFYFPYFMEVFDLEKMGSIK